MCSFYFSLHKFFVIYWVLLFNTKYYVWAMSLWTKMFKNFSCGLSESVDKARIQRDKETECGINVRTGESKPPNKLCNPCDQQRTVLHNTARLLSGYRVHWTLCVPVASHLLFAKFSTKNVCIQITIVVGSEYET